MMLYIQSLFWHNFPHAAAHMHALLAADEAAAAAAAVVYFYHICGLGFNF